MLVGERRYTFAVAIRCSGGPGKNGRILKLIRAYVADLFSGIGTRKAPLVGSNGLGAEA